MTSIFNQSFSTEDIIPACQVMISVIQDLEKLKQLE